MRRTLGRLSSRPSGRPVRRAIYRGLESVPKSDQSKRISLIPETLEEIDQDEKYQDRVKLLAEVGQRELTRQEKLKRQRSLDSLGLPGFHATVAEQGAKPMLRGPTTIFQLNIGLYCNQACNHCHVESSPRRTEMMDRATAEQCVRLMGRSKSISTVDITGGAPELNSQFRYLVREARALGLEVLDRCNLTVLLEPGQEDLLEFLAGNRVTVVASLPCYTPETVAKQRGSGVFQRSIQALQMLNSVGYAQEGSDLQLHLVYNPGGAFLAPSQEKLEVAYKQELGEAYGIRFDSLFCLNNMPIKRFCDWLMRRGMLEEYMNLLVQNFNPAAANGIMCRDTVSVGWDGRLYDCDFNQQLELSLPRGLPRSVFDLDDLDCMTGAPIRCDNHCFGCTAGAGSSCQGSTS